MTHVAFFQPAFLGDCLLCLPTIHALKKEHPDWKMSIFVLSRWAPALTCYPAVDHVIPIEKSDYKSIVGTIFKNSRLHEFLSNVDILISAHRSFSSQLFTARSSASRRIGFSKTPASFGFSHRIPYDRKIPEIQRVSHLLAPLKIKPIEIPYRENLALSFSPDVTSWWENLKLKARGYVVIAAGSRWQTKRWPLHHFEILSEKLRERKIPVVWCGAESELAEHPHTIEESDLDLIGKTSLPQWLILLSRAHLIVSNDSAATHVATLHQIPNVTLFGPTIPAFGYAPTHHASRVGEISLPCRPCTSHGSDHCPLEHHHCMQSLSPEVVWGLTDELLGATY